MSAPLGEIGKIEIVKKELQEFLARQHETKLVLAFAIACLGPSSGRRRRPLDGIAFDEFLVSGQNVIPQPPEFAAPQAGFADAARSGSMTSAELSISVMSRSAALSATAR